MASNSIASGDLTPTADFSWSDNDIESMMNAALHYKSECEYKGVDWESVKLKYDEISKIMGINQVTISKQRVAAKMKTLRTKYRLAVDTGRRSGGGRMVATYYDYCVRLWSGSPAVTSIADGIEPSASSANIDEDGGESSGATTPSARATTPSATTHSATTPSAMTPVTSDSIPPNVRTEFEEFLSTRRSSKMTSKLSQEQQQKQIQREEIELKRKLIDQMADSDKGIADSMAKLAKTMDTFAGSMSKMADAMTAGMLRPATAGMLRPENAAPNPNREQDQDETLLTYQQL